MIPRLRRFWRVLAAVVLVTLVAVGCSSAGFPESYDAQPNDDGVSNVEMNWNEGCQVSLSEELAAEANDVCTCSYARIKADIAFDDFVEVNDRLSSNPEALTELAGTNEAAQQIVDIVKGCIAQG